MYTPLSEAIASSAYVMIAIYLGQRRLSITRSLRGGLIGEVQVGLGSGHPDVTPGTAVVAFLDAQKAWHFVAEIPPGLTPAEAPLRLRGFYDFNAHLVGPGLLTLASLEAMLAWGAAPEWRLRGPLLVLAPDGREVVASSITLAVRAGGGMATTVVGLPGGVGLPAPSAVIGGWRDVSVSFRGDVARSLELEGSVERVDASGAIVTRFRVVEPWQLFREADIRAYLDDADAVHPYWPFAVRFDTGEVWTGAFGEGYSKDPTFRRSDGSEREWSTFSARDERYFEFRAPAERWDLDRPPIGRALLDAHGDARVLLQELHRGPVGFRVASGPRVGRRGVIHLGALELRRAIRASQR